jgi:hypothetical protein
MIIAVNEADIRSFPMTAHIIEHTNNLHPAPPAQPTQTDHHTHSQDNNSPRAPTPNNYWDDYYDQEPQPTQTPSVPRPPSVRHSHTAAPPQPTPFGGDFDEYGSMANEMSHIYLFIVLYMLILIF